MPRRVDSEGGLVVAGAQAGEDELEAVQPRLPRPGAVAGVMGGAGGGGRGRKRRRRRCLRAAARARARLSLRAHDAVLVRDAQRERRRLEQLVELVCTGAPQQRCGRTQPGRGPATDGRRRRRSWARRRAHRPSPRHSRGAPRPPPWGRIRAPRAAAPSGSRARPPGRGSARRGTLHQRRGVRGARGWQVCLRAPACGLGWRCGAPPRPTLLGHLLEEVQHAQQVLVQHQARDACRGARRRDHPLWRQPRRLEAATARAALPCC